METTTKRFYLDARMCKKGEVDYRSHFYSWESSASTRLNKQRLVKKIVEKAPKTAKKYCCLLRLKLLKYAVVNFIPPSLYAVPCPHSVPHTRPKGRPPALYPPCGLQLLYRPRRLQRSRESSRFLSGGNVRRSMPAALFGYHWLYGCLA